VHPQLSSSADGGSVQRILEDLVGERIEALAGWIQELDAQVRTTAAAGDEGTLKELRRALELWSKRDPKFEERLVERVDVLGDRLATLSSTINTTAAAHASSDGEIASLRRELEQETAKLQATMREAGGNGVARELGELRRAIAELSRRSRDRRGDGDADLLAKVANLRERVDTLATTVATTAAGLAGREGEHVTLRKALEEEKERVEQLASALQRDASSTALAKLDGRIDALARTMAAATAALADRERETTGLAAKFQDQSTRIEALADALRASDEALEAQLTALARDDSEPDAVATLDARVAALVGRLDAVEERPADTTLEEVEARLAPLLGEVERLAAAVVEAGARAGERDALDESRATRLDHELEATRARLDEVEQRGTSQVETVAMLDTRLAVLGERLEAVEERSADTTLEDVETRLAPVRAEVERVVATLVEAEARANERRALDGSRAAQLEHELEAMRARLEGIEESRGIAAVEVESARSAWETERTWVREQLDVLVLAIAESAARADVEPLLEGLPGRLGLLEDGQRGLAAELARGLEAHRADKELLESRLEALAKPVAAVPPSEDEQLKELLSDFADRIEGMERERARLADDAARAARAELAQLEQAVDAFGARVAGTEERLTVLASVDQAAGRLEDLGARLQALEDRPPPSLQPGDGRIRTEFRALELRLQHAETAAREDREAVLAQLERLSAEVERRLQHLEEQRAEAADAPGPSILGEVVAIRGGVDT
jgi:chromosome segregation ATPase